MEALQLATKLDKMYIERKIEKVVKKEVFLFIALLLVCAISLSCACSKKTDNGGSNHEGSKNLPFEPIEPLPLKPRPYYTLNYDLDGGEGNVSPLKYLPGDKFYLRDAPTKANYTFVSWSFDDATYAPGDPFAMLWKDMTFKALWNPKSYNLTYVNEGASNALEIEFGAKVRPPEYSKSGYTFLGWKSVGGDFFPLSSDKTFLMPAYNLELTAFWQLNLYTLSFLSREGTGEIKMFANKTLGEAILLPSDGLSNPGHDLIAWSDGVTNWSTGSLYIMPARNVTLEAIWIKKGLRLTYDLAWGTSTGGTSITIRTVGEIVTLAPAPIRQGAIFLGWRNGLQVYGSGTQIVMPATELTLTAWWSINAYTLSFSSRVGTGGIPTLIQRSFGEAINLPSTGLSNMGSYLLGWSDGLKSWATGAIYIMPTQNTTLIAVWRRNDNRKGPIVRTHPLTGVITHSYDCPRERLPNHLKALCDLSAVEKYNFSPYCTFDEKDSLNYTTSPRSSSLAQAMMDKIPSVADTLANPDNNLLNMDSDGDSMIFLEGISEPSNTNSFFGWNSSELETLFIWDARKATKDSEPRPPASALVVYPLEDRVINLCLRLQLRGEGPPVKISKNVLIPSSTRHATTKWITTNGVVREYKLAIKETFNYKKFIHRFWAIRYLELPQLLGKNINYNALFNKNYTSVEAWFDASFTMQVGTMSGIYFHSGALDTKTSPDGKEAWTDEKIVDYLKFLPGNGFGAGASTEGFVFKDYYLKLDTRPSMKPIGYKEVGAAAFTYFFNKIDPITNNITSSLFSHDGIEVDGVELFTSNGSCHYSTGILYDHNVTPYNNLSTISRKRFEGGYTYDELFHISSEHSDYNRYCTEQAFDASNPFFTMEWLDSGYNIQIYHTIGKNPRIQRMDLNKGQDLCRAKTVLGVAPILALPQKDGTCYSGNTWTGKGKGIKEKFSGGNSRFSKLVIGFGASWLYEASALTLARARDWFQYGVLFHDVEIWLAKDNYYENYTVDNLGRELVREYLKAKGEL